MKALLLVTALIYHCYTSVYDYNLTAADGTTIHLSDFRGKKILIVNTASNSQYTSQYVNLEKLYQKYKDSLVIIAIPSGSFGNEPADNERIQSFVSSHYHIHFILAGKTEVTGTNRCPLYEWLTSSAKNGVMSNTLDDDFYKFLIDGSGNLIGAFAPSADPMSPPFFKAIENN